uniref:PTC1-like winged helix-turn-helix domain-containing protein n=3 Tax=Setaria italica TaxID=4555 RepID=K3ZCS4_SETIT
TCGGGGGIIPASRFLRRRAAVRDLGRDAAAADLDAFWAAAPRLYDFSQQQQLTRPPSPPAAARRSPPPEPEPCSPGPITLLQRRSPRPPSSPAARRSASPEPCTPCLLTMRQDHERSPRSMSPRAARRSPSPGPGTTCLLLAVQRTCVAWGATRRVEYPSRHRPASHGVPGQATLAAAAARCGGEDQESASGGAKKRKWLEEVEKEEEATAEAMQESGREDKPVVANAGKSRSRNRRKARWSSLHRRRGAARRAKKVPRVVKEEQRDEEAEAEAEAESSQGVKPAVVEAEKTTRGSRKRAGSSGRGRRPGAAKRVKKTPLKEEKVVEEELAEEEEEAESKPAAPAPGPASRRGKVDRWTAWRYAAGEAALLGILRARGACAGKPAPRAELRAQARRHIGDTGLLDHLLRHVADKVPAGSGERVRRRYNPAGGLEYWLEPAELAATRREAGVDDPYWVPPSGWKLGDPVMPEARALEVQKQVEELAGELDVVKRQMKQLDSNMVQVSKEAYISWKGYDCMVKANGRLEKEVLSLEEKYENATQVNGELKELLLLLKEKYDTVLEKNDRLEEQMVALSTSFQSMKEDLLLQRIGEQPMLMLEQEPWEDKQEASAGNAAAGAGNQLADSDAIDGSFSSNGGASHGSAKRALRKCSVHICRRDGMLQLPRTASGDTATSPRELPEPLTPGGDLVVADFDAVINRLAPPSMEEYLMAEGLPTPTSASSTNASPKLPLLPTPASPVQVQSPPRQSTPRQSTTMTMANLQAAQPYSGDLNLQLRCMDTSSSSSGPCGAKALKLDAGAGGGGVGTELALATPTY